MDVRQQLFSSRRKAEIHKQILNKTWRRWQAMAPHLIPLPCALAFPPPNYRDTTTPSPCWAPHFMTQERIMFSNPTPSKPRLSPAATTAMTRHRLTLRPCTVRASETVTSSSADLCAHPVFPLDTYQSYLAFVLSARRPRSCQQILDLFCNDSEIFVNPA